jgi:hypothetical protein
MAKFTSNLKIGQKKYKMDFFFAFRLFSLRESFEEKWIKVNFLRRGGGRGGSAKLKSTCLFVQKVA